MNIAMMTTWNSACGIAEYSRNLIEEFLNTKHKILLLTNKDADIIEQDFNMDIHKVFGVHWWGEDPSINVREFMKIWTDFEMRYGKIDVFHVQYQGSLYESHAFNDIEKGIQCKKIITFHDSSKHPKHNFDSFISIAHNQDINANNYLPFPTIERTPVVFSFGMGGRNDYAFIEKACTEIGVHFWSHDSRKAGWLSEEQLFAMMNDADAIVLWYNEVPIKGQSAALRTAISSMRPVIVNDVEWFKDAPYFVNKVGCGDGKKLDKLYLQQMLKVVLHIDYIQQNSYKNLVERHIEIYNG